MEGVFIVYNYVKVHSRNCSTRTLKHSEVINMPNVKAVIFFHLVSISYTILMIVLPVQEILTKQTYSLKCVIIFIKFHSSKSSI